MNIQVEPRAEALFHAGPLAFTNSMLTMIITMVLLVAIAYFGTKKMAVVPGRFQAFIEWIIEMLLRLAENTAGKAVGRKIFPLTATLFIFIITANWMGLLPGVGTIGINEVVDGTTTFIPFLRPANADLNMTLAMAIIAFCVFQAAGIISHGPGGHLKEMATPLFLFPIHLISEISRIISLSMRLFGNTFAGDVLVIVMVGLSGPIVVAFFFLEMLFAYIQALVFSVLTVVYISLAVGGHGKEHTEHA